MTLKKCTVIELDLNFWRVDFDGNLDLSRAASNYKCWSGPFCIQVVSARDGMFTAYASGIGTSVCGPTRSGALEAMLSHLGLTRHDPKPETAEERVRRALGSHGDAISTIFRCDDLRAILAELDRAREAYAATKAAFARVSAQRPVDVERDRVAAEYCRIATDVMEKAFDCQVTADCFCHEGGQRSFFNHSDQVVGFVRDAVAEKIAGPKAAVDVEAVLAPFRAAKRTIEAERKQHGASAKESTEDGSYRFGAEDAYAAWAHWIAERALSDALAEAEKIGRGE